MVEMQGLEFFQNLIIIGTCIHQSPHLISWPALTDLLSTGALWSNY